MSIFKSSIYKIIIPSLFLTLTFTQCSEIKQNRESVVESPAEINPILTGMKVPEQLNELSGMIKNKSTILIFYRGGWCPYCNAHFAQIKDVEKTILDLGYTVIAISPDKLEMSDTIRKKYNIHYQLLSDPKLEIIRKFGLAYKLDEPMVRTYKNFNMDIENSSGETHHWLPVPAVYLVNKDGTIAFSYININHKVRLDPDILVRVARLYRGK